MDSDMATMNKSPGSSSHDLRGEHEGPEEDMEAEENVENTTPGVSKFRAFLLLTSTEIILKPPSIPSLAYSVRNVPNIS